MADIDKEWWSGTIKLYAKAAGQLERGVKAVIHLKRVTAFIYISLN